MRLECYVFFLLFTLFVTTTVASPKARGVAGGWTPISNVNDAHVVEIANFAVTEFDKRSGAILKLDKILQGYTQVVSGTNYRLILKVLPATAGKYEAIVWEKPSQNFRRLISFKSIYD